MQLGRIGRRWWSSAVFLILACGGHAEGDEGGAAFDPVIEWTGYFVPTGHAAGSPVTRSPGAVGAQAVEIRADGVFAWRKWRCDTGVTISTARWQPVDADGITIRGTGGGAFSLDDVTYASGSGTFSEDGVVALLLEEPNGRITALDIEMGCACVPAGTMCCDAHPLECEVVRLDRCGDPPSVNCAPR